jgi:Tol biopolymer transport system component
MNKKSFCGLLMSISMLLSSCNNQFNPEITVSTPAGFSAKALTSQYEIRKLQTFLDKNQGANLVKELLFEKQKDPDLLTDIFGDPKNGSLYDSIAINTFVSNRLDIDPAFKTFFIGLKPAGLKLLLVDYQDKSSIYSINPDNTGLTNISLPGNPGNSSYNDDDPHWSPAKKKIVFRSDRDGSWGLYTMNKDGSEVLKLTAVVTKLGKFSVFPEPVWSPNGNKIAYKSVFNNKLQIFTINADGSEKNMVSISTNTNNDPVWFPDSQKLLFTSSSTNSDIYSVNADGTEPVNLTASTGVTEVLPVISPNSSEIVYSSGSTGSGSWDTLNVMDIDGGNKRILVPPSANLNDLQTNAWLPDGSKIIFSAQNRNNPGPTNNNNDIFSVKKDGTLVNLIDHEMFDAEATFSPDFSKFTFISTRTGPFADIFIVPTNDVSNPVNLTNSSSNHDTDVVWSPDGSLIAFLAYNSSTFEEETWVMNPDGSGKTKLFSSPGAMHPQWIK